jgi:farnesyl-diphosphate farnesyltransferase
MMTDAEFCQYALPRVSRTFALSIQALPAGLRSAVRSAYLLCRIIDTIEDDRTLSLTERDSFFDLFDGLMERDDYGAEDFERRSRRAGLGGDDPEHELCARASAVFSEFRALEPGQRDAIRPHVNEMSQGMREYTARAERETGLRIDDFDDLERYCYFVAGTVGKLLTDLFVRFIPQLEDDRCQELRRLSVDFGLGLQMVNIVKDIASDLERGDCFIPEELARRRGFGLDTLLDPANRSGALAIVREVCSRARRHLERATEYTILWPLPDGEPIRFFCAVPLALALATLKEVEEGDDTLVAGLTPKVSRETVAQVLSDAQRAVSDDQALAAFFGALAG